MELKNLFYPKNVCLLGASTKEKSIGYEILKCIKKSNFNGDVYPVNPKADEILGYKNYKNIDELPDNIDLCIVTLPKNIILENLMQILEKNIKNIIMITAGFREVGKEGKELEDKVLNLLKEKNIRMVGPNCMGIINTLSESILNATFVAEEPKKGAIAFASQSGALGAAILNSLRVTDIALGHFISMGNKADINENDLLEFWADDDNIKVITMYLESFVDGKNFLIKSYKCDKPIIVLKSARSQAGQKAASSHTGALANSDDVVESVFKQFGILRAETTDELFNTAIAFDNLPPLKGKKIAIVTNSGGPGVICVDKLEKEGLELAQLSEQTIKQVKEIIHPEGSANNPIDLLPNGDAKGFYDVTNLVLKDENVDGVIVIFTEPIMVKPFDIVEAINSIESDKPILQVVFPLPEFWDQYKNESKFKKRLYRNVEDAVVILRNMYLYSQYKDKKHHSLQNDFDRKLQKLSLYRTAKNFEGRYLSFEESFSLLNRYNLPIVNSIMVDKNQLESFDVDYPLVLKAYSDDIIHKSDVGGVFVNITSREKLLECRDNIINNAKNFGHNVDKFIVQRFVNIENEMLIGGFNDHSFGPMVMFGSGGKYVEILKDTQMRNAILTKDEILDMIKGTNIGKIIQGVRGEQGKDISKLVDIIENVASLLLDNDEVIELDLNPICYSRNGDLSIIDWRIKVSE